MRNAVIVVLSLAVLGLLEAGVQALRYLSERRDADLRQRLQRRTGAVLAGGDLLRQGRFSSIASLDLQLSTSAWARRVEALLEQADSGLAVDQFLVVSTLGVVAGLLSTFWLGRVPGLALAAALGAAPTVLTLVARERRSRAISEQLPEALDMMARSLRAGHALTGAFELVANEMPAPVNAEFARAFEEQRLGMPLERAVREMAARAPTNGDLKIFAVSTVIQKETGGNLAEILDNISRTIRDRYKFYGKLRALTAESKMSAWVVSMVPLVLAAFLAVTQPKYMVKLIDNPTGQSFLAGGVACWVLGVLWFHRLTKLDY